MITAKTSAAEKMTQAQSSLSTRSDLAAKASKIGATYKFVLEGAGGGTWLAQMRGQPQIARCDHSTKEERSELAQVTADCIITMQAGDYVDMVEGRVDPQDLFFEGKLLIDGDMVMAMKLHEFAEIMVP